MQTHRDPLRIIASLGSLVSTLRSLASDDTSNPEAAAEWADYILDGLDRSVTARLDGVVKPDRVVDVQFAEFMADPFATIRTVYERLGYELLPDAEAAEFVAEYGDRLRAAYPPQPFGTVLPYRRIFMVAHRSV